MIFSVRPNKQSKWMKGLLQAEKSFKLYEDEFKACGINDPDKIIGWLMSDGSINYEIGLMHKETYKGYCDFLINKRRSVWMG